LDLNQIHGENGPAFELAGLPVFDQAGDNIGAARDEYLAIDQDGLVDARSEILAGSVALESTSSIMRTMIAVPAGISWTLE